jgi:hypothetical protein
MSQEEPGQMYAFHIPVVLMLQDKISQAFTVECWVKDTTTQQNKQFFLSFKGK